MTETARLIKTTFFIHFVPSTMRPPTHSAWYQVTKSKTGPSTFGRARIGSKPLQSVSAVGAKAAGRQPNHGECWCLARQPAKALGQSDQRPVNLSQVTSTLLVPSRSVVSFDHLTSAGLQLVLFVSAVGSGTLDERAASAEIGAALAAEDSIFVLAR